MKPSEANEKAEKAWDAYRQHSFLYLRRIVCSVLWQSISFFVKHCTSFSNLLSADLYLWSCIWQNVLHVVEVSYRLSSYRCGKYREGTNNPYPNHRSLSRNGQLHSIFVQKYQKTNTWTFQMFIKISVLIQLTNLWHFVEKVHNS